MDGHDVEMPVPPEFDRAIEKGDPMSGTPTPATHVELAGSNRTHRAGAEVLGRSDRHEMCEITIKVRRKAALPEPVAGEAVLTRAKAAKDHGANQADLDAVVAMAKKYGLKIVSQNAATRSVKITGPVEAMEKAFQVHLFRVKHGTHYYRGRVGSLFIPKELEHKVIGVFGLDTRPMAHHRARRPQPGVQAADTRHWYLPQELAAAYGFPDNDGSGQTIGIIELGGQYIASDLKMFGKLAGLASLPTVNIINAETVTPAGQNNDDFVSEVMLDIEVVAGLCPGATLAVYFSNFTEQGWIDVIDAALNDAHNNPGVLSISYGLAEGTQTWTSQAMDAVNDAMKEAAARGIPVCVSAGDDGSDDQCGDGPAHVDFPASSPYVLCVGGTTFPKSGTETVWFEGNGLRKDHGGSTGGGVSSVYPPPAWQSGIKIPSVNPGAPAGRCIPDVSANAAQGTGYLLVVQGAQDVAGGTSAATPLWASLIARLLKSGKKIGYLTPLFYQPNTKTAGLTLGAAACNDITSGNNATAKAGGYSAGPGYDAVTGWGSPRGDKLAALLPP
jgi:kumamolisin